MAQQANRIDCLDGLRGLAALWVMLGHALILSGWRLEIIGQPDLGVDLFILLSGFLMVFHYLESAWQEPRTIAVFWTRRFFRIAPLFYLMLAFALILGPYLYDARMQIDLANGVRPQEASRYLDAGLTNILLHLSFLFGFIPAYAFRTALPDWSIGLEMQFYLFFPLMMLAVHRLGWVRAGASIVATGLMFVLALRVAHIRFPMPAFLPLKLHIFLCGMLCAMAIRSSRRAAMGALVASLLLMAIPIGGDQSTERLVAREVILLGFFMLLLRRKLLGSFDRILAPLVRFLETPMMRWAGDLSYSAYLIHLLVMIPVAVFVWTLSEVAPGAPWRFFLLVMALTGPATYGLAFFTYTHVERRGIRLGSALLRRQSPSGNRVAIEQSS